MKGEYFRKDFFLMIHLGVKNNLVFKMSFDKKTTAMKKQHLPTKICSTCKKPFTWRKKWAKVWEEVKYCSERCRRNKHKAN